MNQFNRYNLKDLSNIKKIVIEVGQKLIELKAQKQFKGEWIDTQFKAEADLKAESLYYSKILEIYPHANIISEESYNEDMSIPENYFLIDPIDGTASFINGFSSYVTQIAWMENHEPKYSIVYSPEMNLFYEGFKGEGSKLNDKILNLSEIQKSDRLLLIDNYPTPRGITEKVYKQIGASAYVESGSLGLKISRIADLTADVFYKDIIVRDWDLAPACLILEEAGGIITDADGIPFQYGKNFLKHRGILATNSKLLHDECFKKIS